MQTMTGVVKIVGVVFSVTILFWIFSLSAGTPTISGKVYNTNIVENPFKFSENMKESVRSGFPARLIIPKIHIDVSIERVGLTVKGAMDTPKNPDRVAWFKLGQRPGNSGTAVIDGHYGIYNNGKVAIFNNLHTLKAGDQVFVKDDAENTITFRVRKTQIYSRYENPPEVFFSDDGLSHLNLITCHGIWDRKVKNYPSRLVVFMDKVM